MTSKAAHQRRHIGSRSFRVSAAFLLATVAAAGGLKIASDLSPTDTRTPQGVQVGNPYSAHWRQAMELDRRRGAGRPRDPEGKIILYPGILDRLYWPPSQDKKDRLTPADLRRLAAHLHIKADRIDPDTVMFEAMILTPDRETRARIRQRNRHAAAPPPLLSFDRQPVPITAAELMRAAAEKAMTSKEHVLKCIVDTCHKLPQPSGMTGHAVPEWREYDPRTYGDNRATSNIGLGTLPPLPDGP
jgi:hypothetical protein